MDTIRFFTRKQFAVVLTFLMVSAVLLTPSPGMAVDQTNEKVAGIIGIIKGQTARLNLVNVGDPNIIPPGPCRGTLSFFDGAGNLLSASTDVSLEIGQATFDDLNADALTFRGRLLVRGVAQFAPPPDPTVLDPCANTRLTLEIFNNKNFETTAFAPEPHLQEPPEPERNFGMVGITQGQVLQLNVINLADGSVTPEPCIANLSFKDTNGRDLNDPVVLSLDTGGGSGSSDLASNGIIINDKSGRFEIRGQVTFTPQRDPTAPNPCANVQASMEVVNAKTGGTIVFIGDPNVIGDPNL
jgi:hypothetical protein